MNGFDTIQVRFKNTLHRPSPFANTREVPFVESYLSILKTVVHDVNTEYFWFFANFMSLDEIDLDFIPEQHEKDQIHVWYNTHPKGGTNKDGTPIYYKWLKNKTTKAEYPDFFPSFWEDEKIYTWGKTKDIMLVPYRQDLKQFYDIERSVNFDMDYDVEPMDIIFISYDEPSAEKRFIDLKAKFPRAKWSKGITGQTLAYMAAAGMSKTDYFFAVFPKLEIVDTFKFDFQPDRMKNPCHYIFNCKNPVNDLEYGHGAVLLYNKELVMKTTQPGLDFTLSQPHDHVPVLSAINHFNETPWLAWRTAFREVIKLCQNKSTVENKYRLKKWLELGKGNNAEWVLRGATDAQEYYQTCNSNYKQLMLSYDFGWLRQYYESKYKNTFC
jgi:hypothetical protein